MKRLDRYLAGAVIGGTLLTLAVLLPLLGFFILADEMESVGTAGYTLADALWFVALSLPRYAYQVFPIATLIGALIGLGQLAARSELVAMRAAGKAISGIVLGALLGGLVLVAMALAIGEGVAPIAEQHALDMRASLTSDQVVGRSSNGFWSRDSRSYLNVREVLPGAELKGIDLFRFEGEMLIESTRAERALYRDGRWSLIDIARSHISEQGVVVERRDEVAWDSLLSPKLLEVIVLEPQVLPAWSLYRYLQYLNASGQDGGAYEVAFWNRIVHPFLMLLMIFVAIPILFGSSRSQGLGPKIFVGILVGIAFFVISRGLSSMALNFSLEPAVAAIAPPAMFLAAGLIVLRRVG